MKSVQYIAFILCISMAFVANAQSIRKFKATDVLRWADTATRPTIFNFWATWCPPCVHELPYFESTALLNKDKGLKLLLVSLDFADEYNRVIKEFVKKNGYTSEIVWLNETDPNYFCPKIDKKWDGNIPVSLFINNKKHYRKFYPNQLTERQLELAVKEMME